MWRLLLAIAVLVALCGLLMPDFTNQPWPTPRIPTSPPDESYRVYLPSGWSIVRPPGWEVFLREDADGSYGSIQFGMRMDNSPHVLVEWSIKEPQIPAAWHEISFQGRPARLATEYRAPTRSFSLRSDRYEGDRITRHGYLSARLLARRDDRWLSIRYTIYAAYPVIPDVMWKYFETVRAPTDAAKLTP